MTTTVTLPPTVNALPASQRARLIHSTRKLGALLGTTPQLLELSDLPQRSSSLSQGGKFAISLKLVKAKTPTSAHHPVLALDIPASYDPRASVYSTNNLPLSPLSASFNVSMPTTEVRRKRMAKLARTLGENIPPELVFGTAPRSSVSSTSSTLDRAARKELRAQRGRSWSVDGPAPSLARTSNSSTRERVESTAFAGLQMETISIPDSASQYSTNSRPSLEHRLPSVSMSRASSIRSGATSETGTKRKEKGWSGEWNTGDMDDVIAKLRGLKAK